MSHLPETLLELISNFMSRIDESLQSEAHQVGKAIDVHQAFDEGYIDSGLTRALICSIARQLNDERVGVEELSNGGCELVITEKSVEWRFRLKRAERDKNGHLIVRVNSDSLLTKRIKNPTLFDEISHGVPVTENELWVVPYLIDGATRTLREAWIARPVDVLGDKPPFKLAFGEMVQITLNAPTPPAFPKTDDDLDFGDGAGEETA